MSELPQERSGLPQEPYRPFPTFARFAETHVDLSTVENFVAILNDAKSNVPTERLTEAVRRATRWAAVDTGAIEGLYEVDRGFTFTVAATAAAWDAMDLQVGDDAARSINDALTAYDYVLDAVTDAHPINEKWLKELHEVICASQTTYKVLTAIGMQDQPLPRGEYKTQQNNPFNLKNQALHGYAPVTDTPAEMHRLILELSSTEFLAADPVLQAAYAHYAFVCIHPFADGNGRVSRALASVYLYRSPGVPLVIFADQKAEYIDALEFADAGNFSLFIEFIANSTIDTARAIASSLSRPERRPLAEIGLALEASLIGRSGKSHVEVDSLGSLMFSEWEAAVVRAQADTSIPQAITINKMSWSPPSSHVPSRFRALSRLRVLQLTARISAPLQIEISRSYMVIVARGDAFGADFVIWREQFGPVEDAFARDLEPRVSQALKYRLDSAASDEMVALVDELVQATQAQLKQSGYTE